MTRPECGKHGQAWCPAPWCPSQTPCPLPDPRDRKKDGER